MWTVTVKQYWAGVISGAFSWQAVGEQAPVKLVTNAERGQYHMVAQPNSRTVDQFDC